MPFSVDEGAARILQMCAGLRAGERVTIVCDQKADVTVTDSLARAASRLGATGRLVPVTDEQLAPNLAVDLLPDRTLDCDVLLGVTGTSVFHSRMGREVAARGGRVLALTGFTSANLVGGAIEADFATLEARCHWFAQQLTQAEHLEVTSPGGLELDASIEGRSGVANTGRALEAGQRTGCLDIEAYIAPVEESVNGTVVVDASSTPFGLVDGPVKIEVVDGRCVGFSGGTHASKLDEYLKARGESASVLAEFGFGLNPSATVIGSIIQDEATYGTGHVAFGSNETFGGKNSASVHCDLVYWKPTLHLDRRPILIDGVIATNGD